MRTVPCSSLNSFSKSAFKCSNMKTTRFAWDKKMVPASVSSTALALRMKRTTPSSSSKALMVRLMADCEICNVLAALLNDFCLLLRRNTSDDENP